MSFDMEMAQGKLGRVIALRLKPGTDVRAQRHQQRRHPQRYRQPERCTVLQPRGIAHQGRLRLR